MTKYLYHVALGVGMATEETRDHLSDVQIDAWRGHITEALKAPAAIPGKPGYSMTAQAISGMLLCTVGRDKDASGLCTFAVVTKRQYAAKAWAALHAGYPDYAASKGDVPRTPYCAVRAEMGLIADPAAGQWLDAYQIAIAWAWI